MGNLIRFEIRVIKVKLSLNFQVTLKELQQSNQSSEYRKSMQIITLSTLLQLHVEQKHYSTSVNFFIYIFVGYMDFNKA
jgi:hypothetical protein